MKRIAYILFFLIALFHQGAQSQTRTVQNRPYTDLRPIHFGIVVGTNIQDTKFENIGPQTLTLKDGTEIESNVAVDQSNWNPGFNVGVLAEFRLSEHFQFRLAPQMYFGTRSLKFYNYLKTEETGTPAIENQSMKTVYVGADLDMIFASKRFNNHRPYVMAGLAPMINLSTKSSDYVQMKKYDIFFEVGIGCDFYLPFFKLRPELKFMMGLTNSLNTDHANDLNNMEQMPYAACARSARSKMFVLSFYFE